ncbi:MAG: glutathione S-transferase family protein [Holosporaceae bacterium]|jgi:glutathione S-transferase|nr:glutathione S-transferase family protein [Holosporaceae bacterium]
MRTLYHYPLCAFSRIVRIYLTEKSLEYDLVQELPWDRRKHFSEKHMFSDIPTLVDKDGHTLEGWYAIVEYMEQIYKTKPLMGHTQKEKDESRRIMSLFNEMFFADVTKDVLFERIIKKHMNISPDSSVMRRAAAAMVAYMEHVAWLSDRRNWLSGDNLTLADISVAAHISCIDYFGSIEWDSHPIVKNWYARIKSRPSFRDILSDRVPAFAPASHYRELDF